MERLLQSGFFGDDDSTLAAGCTTDQLQTELVQMLERSRVFAAELRQRVQDNADAECEALDFLDDVNAADGHLDALDRALKDAGSIASTPKAPPMVTMERVVVAMGGRR